MADVTATATIQVVTKGQESISALKGELESLKSTGQELRDAQFLDPQKLRDNVNATIRANREMEYAARGFGDETANAARAMDSFGRSDAMKQAQKAFVGAQENLLEVEKADGDVETAMKGVKDAGEAYNKVVRAEGEARREIGRQISEQEAALPTPEERRKGIPGIPTAEELRGVPAAAPTGALTLADAAGAAAGALAGLTIAVGVAQGAMAIFGQANELAAASARDVMKISAEAQKAGVTYEEAAAQRAAGVGLFGEKGYEDIRRRFEKNVREGGKGLQEDLETLGIKPTEAPPSPVEFARRAAARGAELRGAVARGEEGAQAALNEFQSALLRRGGPAMARVAGELTDQEIATREEGATRIADAFRTTDAKQTRDNAVAFEKSAAEHTQATKGFWDQAGEAATPGLTKYNEAITQGLVEGGPSAATAAGKFAGWLAGKTGEYLQGKSAQWQAYQDIASGIAWGAAEALKLVTPTPAAAAELPGIERVAPDFVKAGEEGGLSAKEKIEEGFDDGADQAIQKIAPDFIKAGEEGGLSAAEKIEEGFAPAIEKVAPDFLRAGEEGGLSAAEALEEGFPDEEIGQAIAAGIQREPPDFLKPGEEGGVSAAEGLQEGFDVSEITAQISAAGSELGSTAASGITEAGSSGGEAFGSSAASGISAAGSEGGNAFASAAQSGITAAGSAGGAAFASAINPGAIGSAIGSAAAAAISAAQVNVNVNVAGAGSAGGGASTGKDSAT